MDIEYFVRGLFWMVFRPKRKPIEPSRKPITSSSTMITVQPPLRNVKCTVIRPKRYILTLKEPRRSVRYRIKATVTFLKLHPQAEHRKHITRTILQMDETLPDFIKTCHDCVMKTEALNFQLVDIKISRYHEPQHTLKGDIG